MKKTASRPTYPSAKRQWFGIILTALSVALIQIVDLNFAKIHNPASILFLIVLLATSVSGLWSGVVSTGITFAYVLVHYSKPGSLFSYEPPILRSIISTAIFFLLVVGGIGWVQARLRFAGMREYDARVAADLADQSKLKTEGELRNSEGMWQLVVDSAMDAIIVADHEGNVTLWNRNAEEMFGWKADQIIGRSLTETIVPPEYRSAHSGGLARFGETGEANILGKRLELSALAKDGREFPIELTVVAHYREAGTLFVAFVRDLTEQQKLNERLRQAQKMEAIGTLAAGVAHDFNNILASISGNLLLAREDIPFDHPVQESHAEIAKAVSRATNVVGQILTFSNPKAPTGASIDLTETLNEATKLLRAALPANLEIVTHFAKEVMPVHADSTDIHQIVLNLGINAHHAMQGGRGKLELSAEQVYVTDAQAEALVTVAAGPCARIKVVDDGCGMDAATLQRLFDPFFTTKAPGEGTGLGLAVVYGIVERNKGAITVYSEVGKGTIFNVYFPSSQTDVVRVQPKPSEVFQGNGERILYVDDDESLVFMMTRLLPRLNYRVVGKDDPREALELFRSDPTAFDLVITDMSMPHIDGPALVRELKAISSDIPIVMVTGYIRERDLEAAKELGIQALILKPNTAHEMSEDLHRILSELSPSMAKS